MGPTRAEYQQVPRTSSELEDGSAEEFKDKPLPRHRRFSSSRLRKVRRCASRVCRPLYILLLFSFLLACQLLFNSSYHPSSAPPFEIDPKETVYIAANIIDGGLITGAWGRSLLQLVEKIGSDRVFVSIYGGPKAALAELEAMLECPHALIAEDDSPLDQSSIPRTTLPSGESRIKRIAFLAEVRNKALEPLQALTKQGKQYDRVLFINDVFFSAEGATRLLWGTNVNAEGKAEYKAACAADFITSWKYYDTFATRDTEGYSLGVPIFPWFPNEGQAVSRNDVLAQRDNVRVKSCWGGMVSFSGSYFRSPKPGEITPIPLPLRFRSEPEPFWDSSECCLIHADIMALPDSDQTEREDFDTGIYMNPYVRTAYSASTFRYLWLAQRFERLLAPIQRLVNPLVGMPRFNYRRAEHEGQKVQDRVWVSFNGTHSDANENSLLPDEGFSAIGRREKKGKEYWASQGQYEQRERVAERGGYCGVRQLLVLKEEGFGDEHNGEGGGNWDNLLGMVPPLEG